MLAKEMLAKTPDKLLPQKNKRNQNEKLIMVTSLTHLSKILQEKYHQHIEKDIYLKKVFPEKPIIAFRKMKSIRYYIVRADINEANDQKKPNITTPCYSCRKTCHLISSDKTLKNIHNGREIKKLDGGNCRTANIVYAAICKIHGDIYIGNTGEELREIFSKHRHDAKKRPRNNEFTAHIHNHQHELDKDIEVLMLKGNLYQKHERKLWENKFICLLGTKSPTGLNKELKHYRRELYEAFADLAT